MTNRCVIYTRVSSKEQVSNLSLETQRERCEAHAQQQGWVVDAVFVEEGESAKSADRTELQRLLTYCRANRARIQYLLVYSLSRFARNTQDHLLVRAALTGLGIQLRSVTEPVEEGSAGRFVETLLAAVAQLDNDVRSERTVAGMRAALARGRWPHLAPPGYRNARDDSGAATLVPDEKGAPLIRLAFQRTAEGRSQRETLDMLRQLGLKGRGGKPLAAATLSKLLRNPVYAGHVRSKAWGVEAPAAFEPLVDEHLFAAAQVALGGKHGPAEHVRFRPDFPLKGFVRCECGRKLTGYWAKGRSARHGYYECPACRQRARRDALEDDFVALLDELRPRPELLDLFKAIVLDVWNARRLGAGAEIEALRRRADELRKRRDRLVEAFVHEHVPPDRRTFERMLSTLDQDLAEVSVAQDRARVAELDAEGLVDYAIYVLAHAGTLWRDARPDQRVELQRFVLPEGITWGRSGFVRTGLTSLFFRGFEPEIDSDSRVATLEGFEPSIFTLKG